MSEPVRIAVTRNVGVTAPTNVSGDLPDATSGPAVVDAEVGRRPLRQFLPTTYRVRHQMPPWRVLWLLPIAVGLHTIVWPAMWVKLIAVLAGGGLAGWRVQVKMKDARADVRLYANVCITAVMLWLLFAVRCGLWGQPGRYAPLLFLIFWLPLSYLWWDRHRIRPNEVPLHGALPPGDPFIAEWDLKVAPLTYWRLSDGRDIDAGSAYRLHLIPGQTLEDAEQARRKIASLLGGISRSRLVFEQGEDEDEATVQLIVLKKDNPHLQPQEWTGPSLDKNTGMYQHGVYPDGPAFLKLFDVEDGAPHRARNGLWCGATGKGKSRGIALKIAEQAASQVVATWYGDGQDGASAPELEGRVDWYAPSLDEVLRMLRAAWKVMKARGKLLRAKYQEAFRGRMVIRLDFPILQIILDEAQELLKHGSVARLVKALLRMGNKVLMGIDLITQVPLLSELGAGSGDTGTEVIRAMAKAGNVAVYKTEDGFTGRVTLGDGFEFNPQTLPDLPGACGINDGMKRAAFCRTLLVHPAKLWDHLAALPIRSLDSASAKAAGEDYATRHQRAAESQVTPESIDTDDLDAELAILLGERMPGQDAPGTAEKTLTVKAAIFEVMKTNNGPMRRNEFEPALAAINVTASKSAIDQALSWWIGRGHFIQPSHAMYDLLNREEREPAPVA